MKSNNSLGIRVLTRNACLHLVYVSPLGERVLNPHMQLAYATSPTHSWACTQIIMRAYHHVFKSIESLDGDRGVDRRHYAVPFKGILIRSTPEIVLSSKQNKLQESEDEKRAKQDDKLLQGMNSLVFNGNHFPSICCD